jgi:hypothetical protein
VVIGATAGATQAGSVVIGANTLVSGALAHVIINGTNAGFTASGTTAGGFYVKPVRIITGGQTGFVAEGFTGPVYYNVATGEFAVSLV